MELHERIALARKQAGLSQEQLGEKLGVSRQAVSKWESGQTNPDIAYVSQMCRLFGVSADWLLLGEESAKESAPARCPDCQTVITGLDKFCPNCGRSLSNTPSDTYTMLLDTRNLFYNNSVRQDLCSIAGNGWFSSDSPLYKSIAYGQAEELFRSAPCILGRGLSGQNVALALERITDTNGFLVYRDSAGETLEELLAQSPLPHEDFKRFKPQREPLSFGMMVLAVVVAIIICSFL